MKLKKFRQIEKKFEYFTSKLAPLLGRGDRAKFFSAYLRGLIINSDRKNIESIAKVADKVHSQGLHHFVSESSWASEPLLDFAADFVLDDVSLLLIKDVFIKKKGKEAIGVCKQFSDEHGERLLGQTLITVWGGGSGGVLPLRAQLFIPQRWYLKQRSGKGSLPLYQERTLLAEAMLQSCRYFRRDVPIVLPGRYGQNDSLLRFLRAKKHQFIAEISKESLRNLAPQDPATMPEFMSPRLAFKNFKRSQQKIRSTIVTWVHVRDCSLLWDERGGVALKMVSLKVKGEPSRIFVTDVEDIACVFAKVEKLLLKTERSSSVLRKKLGIGHFEGRSLRGLLHHASLCFLALAFKRYLKRDRVVLLVSAEK